MSNHKNVLILLLLIFSTMLFATNYELQYKCVITQPTSQQIQAYFNILNKSNQSVSLEHFTIRYYYSKEGGADEQFWCDYAVVGNSNVKSFFKNGYIELGFTTSAGYIPACGQSGEIQARITKTDWSFYNQYNDFSFNPDMTSYTSCTQVALFYNGNLVYGNYPPGTTLPPSLRSTPVPTPTQAPTATHSLITPPPPTWIPLPMTVQPTSPPLPSRTPTISPPLPTAVPSCTNSIRIYPADQTIAMGSTFAVKVLVNSEFRKIATYGINLTYSYELININTGAGINGVEPGVDGFVSTSNNNTAGTLVVNGFDATGKGPGTNLELFIVNFKAVGTGTTAIEIVVNALLDEAYNSYACLSVTGGKVTVSGGTVPSPTASPTPTLSPSPTAFPTPASTPLPPPTLPLVFYPQEIDSGQAPVGGTPVAGADLHGTGRGSGFCSRRDNYYSA